MVTPEDRKPTKVAIFHAPFASLDDRVVGIDVFPEILQTLLVGFAHFAVAGNPFSVPVGGSIEFVELEYDGGVILGGLLTERGAVAGLLLAGKSQLRLYCGNGGKDASLLLCVTRVQISCFAVFCTLKTLGIARL